MPIVDGRYEAKISTTYATPEEGIRALKRKIGKSRRLRISCIPTGLLEELLPVLKDKDLMIILPLGEKPSEELRKLCPVATTKARIYVDHMGKEATAGSVVFSDIIFNIAWVGDEILTMGAMEYSKCVKCMAGTFEGAWRYSEKVKEKMKK